MTYHLGDVTFKNNKLSDLKFVTKCVLQLIN